MARGPHLLLCFAAWEAHHILSRADEALRILGHNEQLVTAPAAAVHKLLGRVARDSVFDLGHDFASRASSVEQGNKEVCN